MFRDNETEMLFRKQKSGPDAHEGALTAFLPETGSRIGLRR